MIKNCPVCGKAFDVLYPDIWRYVRNGRYICSWKCIRQHDNEKKEEKQMSKDNLKKTRMGRDDMAEAVRMWKANDPGLDQYLTDHGITHIGKWKQNQKLRYGKSVPAATVQVDGPIRIETKEPEKVEVIEPKNPTRVIRKMFGFEVSAIRDDVMGEFYYDIKYNRIDWRSPDGTEVSLSPTAWKEFSEKISAVLNALGVKL